MDLLDDLDSTFWLSGRLNTYQHWPFQSAMTPCNPGAMAEAGFIAVGDADEPDHVECFICMKQLDGWEPTDDPWEEHKKHQPNCPYILLNKKNQDSWTIVETYGLLKEYFAKGIERRKNTILLATKNQISEQGKLIPKKYMNVKTVKKLQK